MSLHLVEIGAQVAPGSVAVLVCGGAGWHQTAGALDVPANIVILPLPPYAPELNPMENVWQRPRANKLCATVRDTHDEIVDARVEAWNWFVTEKSRIQSIAIRDWATVNV